MKYFLDTEFIEGFHKPLFGKRRHFIDLISIGIVAEDGRAYYAISRDFNPKDADEWVKANVISKLPAKWVNPSDLLASPISRGNQYLWKHNTQIAKEIAVFCGCYEDQLFWRTNDNPEFYAYYADYDWVLFCSLFGRMIDLPKGFPMYCRDLKQMFDEKYPAELRNDIKKLPYYPKQTDEHDALADAEWNKELYKFLTT